MLDFFEGRAPTDDAETRTSRTGGTDDHGAYAAPSCLGWLDQPC